MWIVAALWDSTCSQLYLSQSVFLAPVASAPSESLVEMGNLGSRHPDLQTQNMHFKEIPQASGMFLKVPGTLP